MNVKPQVGLTYETIFGRVPHSLLWEIFVLIKSLFDMS